MPFSFKVFVNFTKRTNTTKPKTENTNPAAAIPSIANSLITTHVFTQPWRSISILPANNQAKTL